jgi:hypothetical protein
MNKDDFHWLPIRIQPGKEVISKPLREVVSKPHIRFKGKAQADRESAAYMGM